MLLLASASVLRWVQRRVQAVFLMTQRSVTPQPVTTRVTDPRTLGPFTLGDLGSQGTCMYKLPRENS